MSTLKQQIAATKRASFLYDLKPKELEHLRNAATTLLAVQLVGERKIEMLPKLLSICNNVVKSYYDPDNAMTVHSLDIQRLLNCLNDINSYEADKKETVKKPRQ